MSYLAKNVKCTVFSLCFLLLFFGGVVVVCLFFGCFLPMYYQTAKFFIYKDRLNQKELVIFG